MSELKSKPGIGSEMSEAALGGEDPSGFSLLLSDYRLRLESQLDQFLRDQADAAATIDEATRELSDPLREFVARGGKRLRPALVHFAYQAVGGLGNDRTLPVEMAVELLHTYLLIHDDIMDRAETRRGGSAAHRLFAKEHRRRGWRDGSARHGEAAAILLGDLAHSHAVGLFLSGVADAVNGAQISRCFTEMCREVVIGQYLEMTAPLRGGLKEQDLLSILRLKSGRYSVERPIQLGALLGGASSHVVESLAGYGLAMGEAFQLQDDLLGVFGEREFVGKPVGGDLAEGKFTLLILAAMERADSAQRETILRCLQTEDPDAEEVSGVRTLVERVGAREKIESMVHERLERSAEALKKLDLNAEAKAFFFGLIDYLRERKA